MLFFVVVASVGILFREKNERLSAQQKADERVTAFEERESVLRTVDELRRQAKHQEESYDALVRYFLYLVYLVWV